MGSAVPTGRRSSGDRRRSHPVSQTVPAYARRKPAPRNHWITSATPGRLMSSSTSARGLPFDIHRARGEWGGGILMVPGHGIAGMHAPPAARSPFRAGDGRRRRTSIPAANAQPAARAGECCAGHGALPAATSATCTRHGRLLASSSTRLCCAPDAIPLDRAAPRCAPASPLLPCHFSVGAATTSPWRHLAARPWASGCQDDGRGDRAEYLAVEARRCPALAGDFAATPARTPSALADQFDFCLTPSRRRTTNAHLNLLRHDGTMIHRRHAGQPVPLAAAPLSWMPPSGRLAIGGIRGAGYSNFTRRTRRRLRHRADPDHQINEAGNVIRGDVRYRFVIDCQAGRLSDRPP